MQELKLNYCIDYDWREPKSCAHSYLFPIIERLFNEFRISEEKFILDAGCGGGYLLNEFCKRGYKNLWGFDISPSGINVAKENYRDIKDRFELHDACDRNLPSSFPKKGYDVVLSVEIIEHLYNPAVYLENIRFWLKDKGILILSTPYHGYLKILGIILSNKFDRHFNPLLIGGHLRFFSKKTLYRLLEYSGIKPVKFYGSGRLPFLWKSMVLAGIK